MYTLSRINVFPIKSLGGVSLNKAALTDRGLRHDRRWMLVDENGKFLTQRDCHAMALLRVQIDDEKLTVCHCDDENDKIDVPFRGSSPATRTVKIWKSECRADVLPASINEWFCDHLKTACQLVYMPDDSRRSVEQAFQRNNEIVSFADGFPSLIIGEASLADLNSRLEAPVPMDRFRTNFVFQGGEAYAEDSWNSFRIGDIQFNVVKPCARCVLTTIDQQTAVSGVEPLRTLATYRRHANGGVMFGQNLTHDNKGEIAVGQKLEGIELLAKSAT